MSIFKRKPFIIAEVGSNFHSFDEAKDAVSLAKAVGADAVKFQMFNRREMHGFGEPTNGKAIEPDWLPRLYAKARACEISFMCTAFSVEGYALVNPFVEYHKVASCEANHVRILQALKAMGKPVLLSTGALTVSEIRAAADALRGIPSVLLYCEAAYPARQTDLRKIPQMQTLFKREIGFSDHTTDYLEMPTRAAEFGAVVIEKHFNPHELTDTPDAPHSINCDEFMSMVKRIRGELPVTLGPVKSEEPIILQHKRRCIAVRDIKAGETLRYGDNFGFYRSLKIDVRGLSPWFADSLEGELAAKDIAQGDGLSIEDVA